MRSVGRLTDGAAARRQEGRTTLPRNGLGRRARSVRWIGWPVALALAAWAPGGAVASSAPPAVREDRFDVFEKSIPELQQAMADGRATARQIVQAYLDRIAAYDREGPALNAIVTLNALALAQADLLDRERRQKGPRGPLHGIPVLVKDNYATADMPTSDGTLALATFETGTDAFQVRRLREAGAIILGKTTMHELALSVLTLSSLTDRTRNPYDPRRTPGGSSGGSAAAVAASFAAAAMGTDTCGSIRIPAAFQNLFGLRGTRGAACRAATESSHCRRPRTWPGRWRAA